MVGGLCTVKGCKGITGEQIVCIIALIKVMKLVGFH